MTPFIGYSQFHQYMQGYGCVQLANPNSDCGTPIPVSVFAIAEDDTWHALRLGVAADVQIVPGLTLTADAAYLPYVRMNGVDDHVLRTLLSPEWANGTGAQLELILAYAITDQLKIGIGGRYWSMWTDSGTVDFGGTATGSDALFRRASSVALPRLTQLRQRAITSSRKSTTFCNQRHSGATWKSYRAAKFSWRRRPAD